MLTVYTLLNVLIKSILVSIFVYQKLLLQLEHELLKREDTS